VPVTADSSTALSTRIWCRSSDRLQHLRKSDPTTHNFLDISLGNSPNPQLWSITALASSR
jgi:hypothetical protein